MDTRVVEPTSGVYVPPNAEADGYLWEGPDGGSAAATAAEGTAREHLLAMKGIGDVKADEILAEVGIDGDRSLASLGARQRENLEAAAAEHGAS